MSSSDSKLVFVAYVMDIITIVKIKAREVEVLNILESGEIATHKLDDTLLYCSYFWNSAYYTEDGWGGGETLEGIGYRSLKYELKINVLINVL